MSKRRRLASPGSSGASKRRRLDSNGDSEASSRRRCSGHVCSHQNDLRRLKRKIKRLKKKMIKSVTKKLRKKIDSLWRDQNIQDILRSLDSVFSAVLNQHGEILWYQANSLLQRLLRDVMDEVVYRWANHLHLPILNFSTVPSSQDPARRSLVVPLNMRYDSLVWLLRFWALLHKTKLWKTSLRNFLIPNCRSSTSRTSTSTSSCRAGSR